MVRSQLEYASSVWMPHRKYLIEEIEKVQRRATRLVKECRKLSYEERLRYLKLPTLVYRRHRGDMIETFKIFKKYDTDTVPTLTRSSNINTRGHKN